MSACADHQNVSSGKLAGTSAAPAFGAADVQNGSPFSTQRPSFSPVESWKNSGKPWRGTTGPTAVSEARASVASASESANAASSAGAPTARRRVVAGVVGKVDTADTPLTVASAESPGCGALPGAKARATAAGHRPPLPHSSLSPRT